MSEEMKVRLTCEEGDVLFALAASFGLPEKLGEQSFTVADRAIAADEVKSLYRVLKAHSPMNLKPQRWRLFGPDDNFEEKVDKESGNKYHRMIDVGREVEVRLDDEALSGATWCIFGAVCPASGEKSALPVQTQSEVLWPIAAKLGRTKAIRDLVGYGKGTPRRWKSDEDYDKEKKPEEKK